MATTATINGWQRLSNGIDVEFRHGVPYRVSDNGHTPVLRSGGRDYRTG
jgi:hypothetical protein